MTDEHCILHTAPFLGGCILGRVVADHAWIACLMSTPMCLSTRWHECVHTNGHVPAQVRAVEQGAALLAAPKDGVEVVLQVRMSKPRELWGWHSWKDCPGFPLIWVLADLGPLFISVVQPGSLNTRAGHLLQMPRGNLEGIAPRALVLAAVAAALTGRRYAEAWDMATLHRVRTCARTSSLNVCFWLQLTDLWHAHSRLCGLALGLDIQPRLLELFKSCPFCNCLPSFCLLVKRAAALAGSLV
jgi:hypothetical protein